MRSTETGEPRCYLCAMRFETNVTVPSCWTLSIPLSSLLGHAGQREMFHCLSIFCYHLSFIFPTPTDSILRPPNNRLSHMPRTKSKPATPDTTTTIGSRHGLLGLKYICISVWLMLFKTAGKFLISARQHGRATGTRLASCRHSMAVVTRVGRSIRSGPLRQSEDAAC